MSNAAITRSKISFDGEQHTVDNKFVDWSSTVRRAEKNSWWRVSGASHEHMHRGRTEGLSVPFYRCCPRHHIETHFPFHVPFHSEPMHLGRLRLRPVHARPTTLPVPLSEDADSIRRALLSRIMLKLPLTAFSLHITFDDDCLIEKGSWFSSSSMT